MTEDRTLRPPGRRGHRRPARPVRRLALFHRPHPHALEGAQGLPEERPRIRRRVCTIEVDPRWAPALTRTSRPARHLVVLYWMDRSRRDLGPAGAAPLRRAARHLFAALAGAAQSDRHERGAASQGRGHDAVGGRPRLPRRHAAPRHQALFRLDRLGSRRRGRLARGPQAGSAPANRDIRRTISALVSSARPKWFCRAKRQPKLIFRQL